ncbi:multicopper oxidase family protein [Streptomyces sp. NPDC048717]|uniref:multicopper oxidase family protein n=1 Tax=Streptomyces sp. NPDC048717 TaxID=3154928 RepID=UPI0034166D69
MSSSSTPSTSPASSASLFSSGGFSRRSALGAGLAVAGTGLLAACSGDPAPSPGAAYVSPHGPEVAAAEAKRTPGKGGPVRTVKLTATPATVDLGAGRTVRTWAYGDDLPGKEVRVTAGDTLALTLANHLPQTTSLHWHGLALRNDMDGVPGVTQPEIKAGAEFAYRFTVAHPGTYWFHPHSGTQQDRGLYAPLIVEDPKEPLKYDKEWVVVLDDWVDGVDGSTPEAVLAELRQGMGGMDGGEGHDMGDMPGMDHGSGHSGHSMSMTRSGSAAGGSAAGGSATSAPPTGPSRMMMGATSELLGGDAGDVNYPYYLINGRIPDAPSEFRAKPGDRVRIRFVNAGGDTAFRVALGGHEMTVTHTDGFPVTHAKTDALLLGMGERYDVLVTVKDGVFPLTALAEGKRATGLALLRTGKGAAPAPIIRPKELDGRVLTADRLKPAPGTALAARTPDRTIRIRLTGGMMKYDWGFDGRPYDPARRYDVSAGERVRIEFTNGTSMWHPLHLHGHTFALGSGVRKDTAVILPGRKLTMDFDADNPGLWMIHCHNVYHSESGMMTTLGYRAE